MIFHFVWLLRVLILVGCAGGHPNESFNRCIFIVMYSLLNDVFKLFYLYCLIRVVFWCGYLYRNITLHIYWRFLQYFELCFSLERGDAETYPQWLCRVTIGSINKISDWCWRLTFWFHVRCKVLPASVSTLRITRFLSSFLYTEVDSHVSTPTLPNFTDYVNKVMCVDCEIIFLVFKLFNFQCQSCTAHFEVSADRRMIYYLVKNFIRILSSCVCAAAQWQQIGAIESW